MRSWLLLWVAALGACVDSNSVICGDGVVCPTGTKCVGIDDPVVTVCADRAQLRACEGLASRHRCTTDTIAAGRCYGGACIEATCGNGRVDIADPTDSSDIGEICDDGRQVSADGCSSDCMSNETCGNLVTDLVTGERCDDGNDVDHDGCTSACQPEIARWSRVVPGTPPHRVTGAMVYDVAHHQTVLFGGEDTLGTAFNDTWVFDGNGWTQLFPEQSPSPRTGHNMAYDAARQRVVLFGGGNGSVQYGDTWEWDGTRWSPIPTLNAPSARDAHAMAYDAKRKVVVLFGGREKVSADSDKGDTWLYDGTWTLQVSALHPGGPPPVLPESGRRGSSMAFSPDRGVIVLFGGSSHGDGTTERDDEVWELDAAGWHIRTVALPHPGRRDYGGMAYDVASQRMLLFGGTSFYGTGDQWMLSASGWTQITAGLIPSERYGLAMATDPERKRVMLLGGMESDGLPMWEWNGSAWATHYTLVPLPAPSDPAFTWVGAYDSARGCAVLINDKNQTFELRGTSWIQRQTNPATYRLAQVAYDHAHARTVHVDLDSSNLAVTSLFDGTSWTEVANSATPPMYDPAIAPTRDGLVMFGGYDVTSATIVDLTWTWNGTVWTPRTPAHRPTARSNTAMAYDPIRNVTVMFGGVNFDSVLRDTWVWDGTDWTEIVGPGPDERVDAMLAWSPNRGRMLLVGGSGSGPKADMFEFDGTAWTPLTSSTQAPEPRSSAILVPDRASGGMLLFAGRGPAFEDMWRLGWESGDTSDNCRDAQDLDGDGLAGCSDPDCYYVCAPLCTPGPDLTTCTAATPHCGDGACNTDVESCRVCPQDCAACAAVCGNTFCDAGETATGCPGDCP